MPGTNALPSRLRATSNSAVIFNPLQDRDRTIQSFSDQMVRFFRRFATFLGNMMPVPKSAQSAGRQNTQTPSQDERILIPPRMIRWTFSVASSKNALSVSRFSKMA
jgi:hypothetical protein